MYLQSIFQWVLVGSIVIGPTVDVPASLALVGGTVYASPTADPIADGAVLVAGDSIVDVGNRGSLEIPANAAKVDCSGLTITAGYYNSHVHFFERKWADAPSIPADELEQQLQEMFTRYGFTSVFDLSSKWENTRRIRERIESGEVAGPRIRSTGEGLVPPGALPAQQVLNLMGMMPTDLPVVSDARQAANCSRRLLDEGVDGIKLFLSSPRGGALSESTVAAAVAEAHHRGKPVFIHPNSADDVIVAVRSGVDIIGHTTPATGPWDDTLLQAVKDRHLALTPTLQLWKYQRRHDRRSAQDQLTRVAVQQLRAWIAADGTVLFGTDAGAVEYDPSDEYALMADAGMSAVQILASLTTAPAERFGDARRFGRISAGFQADLVVLKEDPASNIQAFAEVEYTVRAGKIIYRAVGR